MSRVLTHQSCRVCLLAYCCIAGLPASAALPSNQVDNESCFVPAVVDGDIEGLQEVSLLQTHMFLGDQRGIHKQKTQEKQASSPQPKLAAVEPQLPELDTSEPALLQDPFTHLLQTELQVSLSTEVAVASTEIAKGNMQVGGDDYEPLAWTFMSFSFIFTLLCIWHELQTPRTLESNQDSGKQGAVSGHHDSLVAGPIVEELPQKADDARWDFIRLLLIWALIASHLASSFRAEAGVNLSQVVPGLAIYAISGFVFLSGMFSASLSTRPVLMTLVGLPCTLFLLAGLTWIATILAPGKRDTFEVGRSMAEWYVECMFFWRLTIPPVFHFSGKLGLPKMLPMLVVCAASSAAASCNLPDPLEVDFRMVPFRVCLPWNMLVYNAPFFGAGLLFTPDRWSELMDKRYAVGVAYVGLAIFGTAASWPHPFGAVSWSHLLGNTLAGHAVISVCMVVTTTLVIGSWLVPLKHVAPMVADYLICCSRRSLQAFNLHWALFVVIGGRLGLTRLAHQLVPLGSASQTAVIVLTALWLTLVLSSRFSELLFGWLLNLPVQLVDSLSQRIEGRSTAAQKAFDVFGPVKLLEKPVSFTSSTYSDVPVRKKLMGERAAATDAVMHALLMAKEPVSGG